MLLLDLTHLPQAPGPFAQLSDSLEYDPRPPLQFLREVSREISRPIARDDRVHIEYVPTQVVTEYVRAVVQVEGRPVDGIRYKSSRNNAANSLVLFADQSNVIFTKAEQPDFYRENERWLRLEGVTVAQVTSQMIRDWRTEPQARSGWRSTMASALKRIRRWLGLRV